MHSGHDMCFLDNCQNIALVNKIEYPMAIVGIFVRQLVTRPETLQIKNRKGRTDAA